MWTLIFGGLILGTILCVFYLTGRFAKFSVIRKAAKERKWFCSALGFLLVFVILFGAGAAMGAVNAAVVALHLAVIWMLCDGIGRLLEKKRKAEFGKYYAGAAAIGITAVYLTCGWYLAHHVWRTEYKIDTEKEVGNLRIVQFADSHVGNMLYQEKFSEQMQAIQAEHPDIVVITGDFVDDDTSREDMTAACEALGELETTYGVYYVFGNHDKGYYEAEYRGYTGEDLTAELEKNNVTVLQDEIVLLDDRFYLIGRQDASENHRGGSAASMEELTEGLSKEKYSIVLDHQPYDYDAQEAAGVDLVLSGHTHGGQLFPFNRMGQWTGIDDKSYGLERRSDTNFIVTSGISDWAIKFKTGCKSEYVVVDIQGAETGR